LAATIGNPPYCGLDLDLQGPPLVFLLVVTNGYPLGHDLDYHLPSLFWLQLLAILLVVILIFEVLLLFFSWL
jgi:hypothetical protein